MVEKVETGGIMKFEYDRTHSKLDEERKRAIEEGYRRAGERKVRDRRSRRIGWVIGVLLIILICFGIYLLIR